MSRILIDPVTRIEGHAKITIQVDEAGKVADARFHVTELRGFEQIALGRPFEELPGLMARVCGICPVSHILASSKAGDRLLGVAPPPAAELQRRLGNYAQVLQSHALSFFHLSSPDLLLGMDADPARRNLFALAESEPDFVRQGIGLRKLGQRTIELLGGKRIHPAWSIAGGVERPLAPAARDELLPLIAEAYPALARSLERLRALLERFPAEVESLGNGPSLFLGTVDAEGRLELYEGHLRLVDAAGNVVAEALEPERYATFLGEAAEDWSFIKSTYYQPLGYPGGHYRVGPLARLNVCTSTGTPRADRELRLFREACGGVVNAAFHYHWARLIEMVHAVERMEQLLLEPALYGAKVRAKAMLNHLEAVGACEAPRGTLFHHYRVGEDGLLRSVNLLIATQQNNLAMNQAVKQAAERFVRPEALAEGMLNRVEAAIRCYDPCLSCSTHALGQMPLLVEVRGPDGALLHRRVRG